VPPAAQDDFAERHVADRQVERAFQIAAVGERLGTDLSARVQAAMPAVTGSSSMPVTCALGGANAMKFPDPQPGSSTRPPVKPSSRAPSQIAATSAASV